MQHLNVPSFLFAETMFDARGLLAGCMTPCLNMSDRCSIASMCDGGYRRICCRIGLLSPTLILCVTISVHPRSHSSLENTFEYLSSICLSCSLICDGTHLSTLDFISSIIESSFTSLCDFLLLWQWCQWLEGANYHIFADFHRRIGHVNKSDR